MGGERAHCRQGSAALERPVFKSLMFFVKRRCVRREKASVTEGSDQMPAARVR